jgi:hypothetical protein
MNGSASGFLSLICLAFIIGIWRSVADIKSRAAALSRIEVKLDLLLADSKLIYDPYADLPGPVAEAVRSGNSVLALRLFHEANGVSMKEAKDFIDEARRRAGAVD